MIESRCVKVEELFGGAYFKPANVQRDYQWTTNEVSQLVADLAAWHRRNLLRTHKRPYFMGTIVSVKAGQELSLFDGLQRATTLTLLICALRDRISDDILTNRLDSCVSERPELPRLRLAGDDNTLGSHIQSRGATLRGIVGGFGRRIVLRQNLNTIVSAIDALPDDERAGLAADLLERVVFIHVVLDDAELAEQVFETINMRGLRVEPHELVKNRLSQFGKSTDHAFDLAMGWDRVRHATKSDEEGFVQAVGDLWLSYPDTRKKSIVDILSDWMAANRGEANDPLSMFVAFSEQHAPLWNPIELAGRAGRAYADYMVPLLPICVVPFDDWKALALAFLAASKKPKGDQRLAEQFSLLQRRCMALSLSQLPSHTIRSILREALIEFKSGSDPFSGALSFAKPTHRQRIQLTLSKPISDFQTRRVLLKWIELRNIGNNVRFLSYPYRDDVRDPLEVEHVLPAHTPEGSMWSTAFPNEDDLFLYPDKLGNLILVPQSLNRDLGQSWIDTKKKVLAKNKHKLTKVRGWKDIERAKEWNAAAIDARTARLAAEVWTDLKLPGDNPFAGRAALFADHSDPG